MINLYFFGKADNSTKYRNNGSGVDENVLNEIEMRDVLIDETMDNECNREANLVIPPVTTGNADELRNEGMKNY